MSASPLSLTRETDPSEQTVRTLADGLDAYNARFFPGADWAPKFILARDAAGAVQGGVRYLVALEWLFVNWLWVASPTAAPGRVPV